MSSSNEKTILAYTEGIDSYITNAPSNRGNHVQRWIHEALLNLDASARILELGSAYGRDATYIESLGYTVEKTDATQAFVALLQEHDPSARILDAISDPIEGPYDLILANAVLLHFDEAEVKLVLTKTYEALNAMGRLAISLKEGEGEEWAATKGMPPRYFHYWNEEAITQLLSEVGYKHINVVIDDSDKPRVVWLMIVAEK